MYVVLDARKALPVIAILFFFFLFSLTLLAMSRETGDAIVSGVRIFTLDVGGLTREEARHYITPYMQEVVKMPVNLVYGYRRWRLYPDRLRVSPDIDAMLQEAYNVGRTGSMLTRWLSRGRVRKRGWEVPLQLRTTGDALDNELKKIASELNEPPSNARFEPYGTRVRLIPSRSGLELDLVTLKNRFLAAAVRLDSRVVEIPVNIKRPEVTTEEAREWGIESLVAEFTTHFDLLEEDRANNICLASEALRGVTIAPEEEFSFNATVGPRLTSQGYRPAPIIIAGELLSGIGGGVCQVSTTLYNTALLAGLAITERIPHSLPVTYVPLGQDATVAYDYIDLRFINNRPEHILIWSTVKASELTVSIYGRMAPGEVVRLESQIDEVLEPEVKIVYDPSLPPGKEQLERKGMKGYRVAVWRNRYRDGVLVEREKVNQTTYEPRDRVIRRGR